MMKFLLPLIGLCSLMEIRAQDSRTAADLLPESVVYLTVVPDMPKFEREFYLDHKRSIALPIIDQAAALNKNNPLIPLGPGQKPAALGFPVFEQLALDADHQLFLAQLPDENGQLQFVAGCQTKDSQALAAKMEAAAKKLMPLIEWKPASDSPNAKETYMLGVGTIRVSQENGWTLVGTSVPTMQTIEKRLRRETVPATPLSGTPLWQTSMDSQDPNALLLYFTNLRFASEAALLAGDTKLSRLLSDRMSGVHAYSWSWNGSGAGSLSYDKMILSLNPQTREALSKIFLPAKPLPGGLADGKTLVKFSTRIDLGALSKAPALQGTKVTTSLEDCSGEVDYAYLIDDSPDLFDRPSAHWIGTGQPEVMHAWWKKHFPGHAIFKIVPGGLLITKNEQASAHFASKLNGTPDRNPLYSELKSTPEPFAVLELDNARVIDSIYQSVRSDPQAWYAMLAKHQIHYTETLPELDLGQYMTLGRMSVGFEGDNVVLVNAVKLGKWTNSMYTAVTTIATCVGKEPMEVRLKAWRNCFEWKGSPPVPEGGAGDDLFTALLWSNLLLGPVETSQRSLTLLLDLYSMVYLATPISPLGE